MHLGKSYSDKAIVSEADVVVSIYYNMYKYLFI
jgi:hypothetical protein